MADDLERIYTIPLRKAFDAPRTRRGRRAMAEVKRFITRHMNADEDQIWVDDTVNDAIWSRGMQNPPRKIRVRAIKFEDGVVEVSVPEE